MNELESNDNTEMTSAPLSPIVTSLTHRVIEWNACRYKQEYNENLQISLLVEEASEGLSSSKPIDILDSIGDQLFVAIGCFWKAGLLDTNEKIACVEQAIICHSPELLSIVFKEDIAMRVHAGLYYSLMSFAVCFKAAEELKAQLESPAYNFGCHAILRAVVDSNETKVIVTTPSDVKANIAKGTNFVPPIKDLEELLTDDVPF